MYILGAGLTTHDITKRRNKQDTQTHLNSYVVVFV